MNTYQYLRTNSYLQWRPTLAKPGQRWTNCAPHPMGHPITAGCDTAWIHQEIMETKHWKTTQRGFKLHSNVDCLEKSSMKLTLNMENDTFASVGHQVAYSSICHYRLPFWYNKYVEMAISLESLQLNVCHLCSLSGPGKPTMVTGVRDNEQPDDLEAREGAHLTLHHTWHCNLAN